MKTHRQTILLLAGIVAVAVLLASLPSIASASISKQVQALTNTSFIVNDPSDPGGVGCTVITCSLRAAITAANADVPGGPHTIEFALIYPATITLTSPLPPISGTLVINGPGLDQLAISGDGQFRVFEVQNGANLTLSGVTIRNGYVIHRGGGILIDHGSLILAETLLDANMAGGGDGGGLYNDGGAVTISNTTFLENSAFHHGAISNNGTMTVTNSLFNGNHARIGGAISSSGSLTVTNTTFTDNIAPQIGGGAIENSGVLVVANSTFYRNGSTMGADIINGSIVNVTNSTFYSATLPSINSIASSGAITLSNTLLAAGAGIDNCSISGAGTLAADAYNLASDATCASATQVTIPQLALGSFQDYGGHTPTLALLPGSAAIDAALDALCAAPVGPPQFGAGGVDQRGVVRPQGAHCDVGAFEVIPPLHLYLPWVISP